MELINFRLSGKFAHFLRAEASASALSYPVPPRTVILGILGAVLGLRKDEPQIVLEPANIAITGKLPATHWHRAKFRKDPPAPLPCLIKKTQKADRNTMPEKATLILQEWLFNPDYTIWVSIPEHYHTELKGLSINDAIVFRLKTQLIFSLLLEADKALLAVKEPQTYLERKPWHWRSEWIEQRIGTPEATRMNNTRQLIRNKLMDKISKFNKPGIFSLTAPTGSGKTLLSATWLLRLREKISQQGVCPKAIVVLPFLSVIDQTTKEYEAILTTGGEKADGSWFLTSHSLSDRRYKQGLEEEAGHFFVDTWRTELLITTYDQFLMTLMDSRTRYQMRFHNLCDSLIVMDEVQSLPCKLWKPLEEILRCLVKIGNSSILLMSATLPFYG